MREPYYGIWKLYREFKKINEEGGNVNYRGKYRHYSRFNVFRIWFGWNISCFYKLHFKKCGAGFNSHFFNDIICLRCKKTRVDVDMELSAKYECSKSEAVKA